MENKQIDILVPQQRYLERDSLTLIDVMYHLEKMGYNIKVVWSYDSYYYMDKYKPKVVLLTDLGGDYTNVKICQYAKQKGIITISLSAEGLDYEYIFENLFWGWNTKREDLLDLHFVWNSEMKEKVLKAFPKIKERIEVSGAIIFDKYSFVKFKSRDELLARYGKFTFKKVITYAGTGLSSIVQVSEGKKPNVFNYTKKEIDSRLEELYLLRDVLEKMITNNPDVLFILKKHPQEYAKDMDILEKWGERNNVLIIHHQENITDLINVSDIWINYESTTSMESWLMKKPVIQIIKLEYGKYHSPMFNGNVVAEDYEQLQKYIDEFYKDGKIDAFDNKKEYRERFITSKCEYVDGNRGYHTASVINSYLSRSVYRWLKPNLIFIPYCKSLLKHWAYNIILNVRIFKRFDEIRGFYDELQQFESKKKHYYDLIDKYWNTKYQYD